MDEHKRGQVFEDAKKAVFFKAVDQIVESAARGYRDYSGPTKADGLRNAINDCALQIIELMDGFKNVTGDDPPAIGLHLHNG